MKKLAASLVFLAAAAVAAQTPRYLPSGTCTISGSTLTCPTMVASTAVTAPAIANQAANNTSNGVAIGDTACYTAAATVSLCPASATRVAGIVTGGATGSTAGQATVAISGTVSANFDGTPASGDCAVTSTTTAGLLHDGGTLSACTGTFVGLIQTVTGTTATVTLGAQMAPATTGSAGITVLGTITPGDCIQFASATQIQDTGFPCGSGGAPSTGQLASPTISPGSGTYVSPLTVTLTCASGATCCFTADGSTPTATTPGTCANGNPYTGTSQISVTSTGQRIALATESGWANSALASASYTITTNGTLSTPTFSPVAGTYVGAQSVTISSQAGSTTYYCIDQVNNCVPSLTYSGPVNVGTTEYLRAQSTESGWVNSAIASASFNISFADNFARANGSLGSNWTQPAVANGGLQIISNDVFVNTLGLTAPNNHEFELYTGGTLGQNQWSSFTITGLGTPPNHWPMIILRAANGSNNYYNDAIGTDGTQLGIHNSSGYTDFYPSAGGGGYSTYTTTYAVGDTHEMDVAGTNPTFIWMRKNGVTTDSYADNTYNYTGGTAGIGIIDASTMTPVDSVTNWQGGTLPGFSATPADNFHRADSGWLGDNWWFPTLADGSGHKYGNTFVLSGNSVHASAANFAAPNVGGGLALWTTPYSGNERSAITISTQASGDWIGPVVRDNLAGYWTDSYYLAIAFGGSILVYARSAGGFVQLVNLGSYTLSSGDVLELDASGTSPVSLTVKINGTTFGTYSDSTYKYTGTYEGFANSGNNTATVITAWQGGTF
ncbi:MAG TPA: chitobiase/beta-hexosaminidase C-terminal domain-containing protein [Terracidiphilus sp.]|nr:chitobiase/beta-hexosaminidase C-terminal domain-containing protein [Terracidiphilus sp.]